MKKRPSRGFSRTVVNKSVRKRSLRFESLEPRYVLDGSVVINEIMYHPEPVSGAESNYEWIELYNQMSIDMDISGWRLEGGVQYTFAEGTVIPGRGYSVISSNPTALAGIGGVNIAPGNFSGALSNSGEEIVLVNRDGRQLSVVDYADTDPWAVGADGSNFSLAKLDQYSASSDPASWRASRQANGTPGAENSPSGDEPSLALVFNEIPAATSSNFWVEIANQGATSINLSGYQIKTSAGAGATYTFASQTLAAGEVLLVDQSALGFGSANGDKLFFFSPAQDRLLDARIVTNSVRGLEPLHGLDWLYPTAATPGAVNTFQLNSDIVINEIMYHAIPNYPVANTTKLVAIDGTTLWRYKQTGSTLASNWAGTAHPADGSTWFQGPGVLAYEDLSALPPVLNSYPIRTTLADPLPTGRVTTYFETDFTFNGSLTGDLQLSLGHIVDDGAIFYLNGVEVLRYNMPAGSVNSNTRPASGIESAYVGPVAIPKTALVMGLNRLSVEVHQVAATTDVVMGAELLLTSTIPFAESPEEWVELYNKSAAAVDVSGWKLADGITYTIPSGTIIPAGGYLVVAKDPLALAAKYPAIASIIVGGFSGSLSNTSDNLELNDAVGNPVDNVRYFDSANWHENADGGGSSLELRSPHMDNTKAEAWAASVESGKSDWNTYTYTMTAAADTGPSVGGTGNFQWNEFLFGFIESGEVLIDDVSVVSSPGTGSATQLIQNGSFQNDLLDSSPSKWRLIGNHSGKVVVDPTNAANKVLDLVATGRTDHEGNNAGTTLANGAAITNGTVYQVTFKAKWVSGSPQLNSRLFLTRVGDTVAVEVPHNNGTPGAQNSTFVANAGPTYSEFKHGPVLPSANQAVTISVRAQDPDGMATLNAMRLFYSVEGAGFISTGMTLQSNGLYAGTIPGQSAGKSVQFYVQGTDALGATSTFPAAGGNSRAMYEVNDGLGPSTAIDGIRIIAKASEASNLLAVTNIMGNQNIGATIIYNNNEVFYDVGLRLKGSSASRGSDQWGGSYSIEFNPDHLFRDVYGEISLDSSGRGAGASTSNGQQQVQILVNQILNHAGSGLASNYDDFAFVVSPNTAHTGIDVLQLARYGNDYLDEVYANGSDGNLFEYELVYYSKTNSVPGDKESLKNQNGNGLVNTKPGDLGDDPDRYRWVNILKNNRDEQDFSQMIAMMKAFSLTDPDEFLETISSIIDVDQWLRTIAASTVMGVSDTFANADNFHNINFYVRPSDGKIEMLPWDWDEAFGLGATSTIHPGDSSEPLRRLLSYTNDHLYFSHLYDLVTHELNRDYMDTWVDYFYAVGQQDTSFLSQKNYIGQRHDSVLAQIKSYVYPSSPTPPQFNITTNNGNSLSVITPTVTLNGTGYVDFHTIRVRGSSTPLDVTWSTYIDWEAVVPLAPGDNNLILDAYDVRGNLVHSDSISVHTEANLSTPLNSLRITEMNYHPADPPGGGSDDDFEYIELTNIGSNAFSLENVSFTGINFVFPAMDISPGQHIVLVKNEVGFIARYGNTIRISGVYTGSLNNSGETITLLQGSQVIQSFTYADTWLPATDGPGYSMVVTDSHAATTVWNSPAGWRRSTNVHGSPGATDPPYVDGDYNRNGTVESGDYVVWRKALGTPVVIYSGADGDGDGMIDQDDYNIWRADFGKVAPPSASGSEVGSSALVIGTSSLAAGSSIAVESGSLLMSEPQVAEEPRKSSVLFAIPVSSTSARTQSTARAPRKSASSYAASQADDALVAWLASRPGTKTAETGRTAAESWCDEQDAESSENRVTASIDEVFANLVGRRFGRSGF